MRHRHTVEVTGGPEPRWAIGGELAPCGSNLGYDVRVGPRLSSIAQLGTPRCFGSAPTLQADERGRVLLEQRP